MKTAANKTVSQMEKEIQKEMMNLAYQPNKVAELIYEITLAAKEQL